MWSSQNGELLWDHLNDSTLECILGVRLASNGLVFGAMEENGNLLIFDMSSTPQLIHQIDMESGGAAELDFSDDNQKIVATGSDDSLRIYDVTSGSLLNTIGGHTEAVLSVDYNSEGTMIASGAADGTVRIWNAADGASLAVLPFNGEDVNIVKFNTGNTKILVGLSGGDLAIIDVGTSQSSVLTNIGSAVICADWSDDESAIVVGTISGIKIFSASDGALLRSFNINGGGSVSSVAYSHDGTNRVCSGHGNGAIVIWDQVLGVGEDTELSFGFYPNPVDDILFLQIPNTRKFKYTVYSFDGRKLSSGNLNMNTSSISFQPYPAGTYILSITDGHTTKAVKITKMD